MTNDEMKNYVRFREIAVDDIPERFEKRQSRNRWEIFVEEFMTSEFKAAEVDIAEGKTAKKEAQTLRAYLKKKGLNDLISVVVRKEHLYVINTNLEKPKKKASNIRKSEAKRKGRPRKKPAPEETMIGSSYTGIFKGSESTEVDYI